MKPSYDSGPAAMKGMQLFHERISREKLRLCLALGPENNIGR
jgi:hypothetical protein